MRREHNLLFLLTRIHSTRLPPEANSEMPTGRKQRKFSLMVIPKTPQAILPFESKPKDPPRRKKKLGKLHAVFREPRQRKVRAFVTQLQVLKKEKTAKINQGNIALKRVVDSIANGDSHVPFRGSKLTMLLQDSFEDDGLKILMKMVYRK
ncbi:hypothetical protein C5167_027424 [Papaver somniferum]|nr:hypothetical protein C5167_027424 [Papaver somniferum]